MGIVKPIQKLLSFTFLPSQAPGGNQEIEKTQMGFLQRVSGLSFQDTVSEWRRDAAPPHWMELSEVVWKYASVYFKYMYCTV